MAQERPNRMAEWVMLVRKNAPIIREQVKDWAEQVREEPRLLWETPAVRYATYGVGAVVAGWLVVGLVTLLTPPRPPGAKDPAITADFRVLCTNPGCGYSFVIQRPFGFDDFPVACPRCKKDTGEAGRKCTSGVCQGRWVVPVRSGDTFSCPQCGTVFP